MRIAAFFLALMLVGFAGCRGSSRTAQARPDARAVAPQKNPTGPLTQQDAEREALQAVARHVSPEHMLSIVSVKDKDDIYEVLVRIDPPKTGPKKLPEHWTVDIPKGGISANTCET